MYKIVLDPGHGGEDPGAISLENGLREKDITLKIALYAKEFLLKNSLASVKLTRENDVFIKLRERSKIAKRFKADFFVSIHVNAGGGTGFESYIYLETKDLTLAFQQSLHNEIINTLHHQHESIPNRGLKRANYAVLRETSMPAVLTENLFIERDFELLKDEMFLKDLGEAHARGIAKFLKLETLL
ncbi:N-acetylmuramoyl-L-alanine amidase [Priestia megaterium]|uniref:N-acetylmuramoyl-L-alanine amidase n=1 Tax=Priestia megaterium TaxID=1404 RepID=UPI001C22728B|nr:N-acetylmuramoyl-L-alanine amidase [Priestia megaterium]MBU8589483.1 N-acetylmuramoyl-L-alanine amidase [Priestia megaterium]